MKELMVSSCPTHPLAVGRAEHEVGPCAENAVETAHVHPLDDLLGALLHTPNPVDRRPSEQQLQHAPALAIVQ